MTTNIGARQMTERSAPVGFVSGSGGRTADIVMSELKKALRPEFINRVDEIAVFSPLGEPETEKICRLMLDDLIKRAADRGVKLEVTDAALKKLARLGHSDKYGARSMYRTIVKRVEDRLAEMMLKDTELRQIRFDEKDV
jgi:ATP-dependent Clp protease ATP-binding subunit ClpC